MRINQNRSKITRTHVVSAKRQEQLISARPTMHAGKGCVPKQLFPGKNGRDKSRRKKKKKHPFLSLSATATLMRPKSVSEGGQCHREKWTVDWFISMADCAKDTALSMGGEIIFPPCPVWSWEDEYKKEKRKGKGGGGDIFLPLS